MKTFLFRKTCFKCKKEKDLNDFYIHLCVICGKKAEYAHRENYDKPLEIIWLCCKHHHDLHTGKIKIDEVINE
jgi:hypothetical protein